MSQLIPWQLSSKTTTKLQKKKESSFWKQIRQAQKKTLPNWTANRIETWAVPGIPDALFCTGDKFVLVELKTTCTNRVRLSPHQLSFFSTHQNAPAFLVIHATRSDGESIYLYSADQVLEVHDHGLSVPPLFLTNKPFDWPELFQLIST